VREPFDALGSTEGHITMQLYGHFISLTTLQVLTLLAEKHASAQLCLVDVVAKEQRTSEHRARHPFGHIPVLEDGDFTLYETHAILRYLDSRLGGPTFVPSDLKEHARMDQWLCIEQNYLMPAAKKVNARGYAKMLDLPDPGEDVVKEGHQQLHFAIEQFARWIDGRAFIAGAAPSLADICWAADLSRMGSSFEKKPMDDARIKVWWNRMTQRPSFEAAQKELARYKPG
jgi:glutathione S-transferase